MQASLNVHPSVYRGRDDAAAWRVVATSGFGTAPDHKTATPGVRLSKQNRLPSPHVLLNGEVVSFGLPRVNSKRHFNNGLPSDPARCRRGRPDKPGHDDIVRD